MRHSSSPALFPRLFPILLLFLLLLFPTRSVQGASNGLLLWFNTVLPTLAPFMICTQLVVALGGVNLLIRPFYPLVHALFGLSTSGTYVLLCGLLCGYPLGAKICNDFLCQNKLSRGEASYLMSICNHPSPMFLLGFVSGQMKIAVPPLVLLTCLYLPIVPVSLCSRRYYHIPQKGSETPALTVCEAPKKNIEMEEILLSTAETMVVIGGYIMIFSILAVWIGQITFLSPTVTACLTGVAEITTGVNQICSVLSPFAAISAVVATVAFGGFSGIFQTKSVIKNTGLSIRHYLLWKILHTIFAYSIITLLLTILPL